MADRFTRRSETPPPASNIPGETRYGAPRSAAEAGSGASSARSEMAEQAKQRAGQAVDQVKEKAGQAAGKVQQQAASRMNEQKDRAASGLSSVANALRSAGQEMRGQEQNRIAGYAAEYSRKAADQIDRFSSYLQRRQVGDMMNEVERFARRRPGLFIGGAFLLGMLGGRFLKSSKPGPEGYERTPRASTVEPLSVSYVEPGPGQAMPAESREPAPGRIAAPGWPPPRR